MINIKQILTLLLLLSIGFMKSSAQEKVLGVIIELQNGEKMEYMLSDNPRFVYDGNIITFTSEGMKIEYFPTELAKVLLGEVTNVNSGDEAIEIGHSNNINIEGGFIRMSGFASGEPVNIYSIDGSLVYSYKMNADGLIMIPLSSLSKGIFIIKTNTQSIKIIQQ